jgi:hypothetical protein
MLAAFHECLNIWSIFLHPLPHIVRRDALIVVGDRIVSSGAMGSEGIDVLLGRSAGDGSLDKGLQRQ